MSSGILLYSHSSEMVSEQERLPLQEDNVYKRIRYTLEISSVPLALGGGSTVVAALRPNGIAPIMR